MMNCCERLWVGIILFLSVGVAWGCAARLSDLREIESMDARGVCMYSDHYFSYVADAAQKKLRIFRFTDLEAEQIEVGNVDIDGTPQDVLLYWYAQTNIAYVLTSSDGLFVVNVTDPENPVVESQFPLTGYCSHIESGGDYLTACVACGDAGVRILDLSVCGVPSLLGRFNNGYYFHDVAVLDRYVYAAVAEHGFLVLDINDPSNIYVRASRDAANYVSSIAVGDRYSWKEAPYVAVGDGNAGVRLFTLDPDAPTYLGQYVPPGTVHDVAMRGECLLVADSLALRLVSLSDPFNPHQLAAMTTTVNRVHICGRLICATGPDIHFARMTTTPWDYEGDGCANIAVCDAAREYAYIRCADGSLFEDAPYEFLQSGGCPQSVDSSGLGKIDPQALYNNTGGWWWPTYGAARSTAWGWGGVLPVAGDYDYDRFQDMAVYDRAAGDWYIHLSTSNCLASGAPIHWGTYPQVPVPGDYSGDGVHDLTTYDPTTGDWDIWFFDPHFRITPIIHKLKINWGWSDAVPVPADYDGDGRMDIAVYHPAVGNWYIRYSSGGSDMVNWGWSEALPVPADYDGDGCDDVAVYHPGPGMWYLNYSSGGSATFQWGWSEARPLYNQYWINRTCGLLP